MRLSSEYDVGVGCSQNACSYYNETNHFAVHFAGPIWHILESYLAKCMQMWKPSEFQFQISPNLNCYVAFVASVEEFSLLLCSACVLSMVRYFIYYRYLSMYVIIGKCELAYAEVVESLRTIKCQDSLGSSFQFIGFFKWSEWYSMYFWDSWMLSSGLLYFEPIPTIDLINLYRY